jgi:hypothetical protein
MWFRNGFLTLLALGAFVCLGQSSSTFKKAKMVGKDGSVGNAELTFLSDRKLIAIRDSHQTVIDIPYDKIARMSYWRAEQSQTGKKIAAGALTWGLGALLVPKAVQYHLFINYDDQGSARQVELLFSDSDWVQLVHIASLETGKEIVMEGSAPPASASAPPATGQPSPTAGPAQTAASPKPAEASSMAAPPPPAPTSRGALTITSTPPGADIQVNGAYWGNTPSTLRLDPGDYSITVEKQGYPSWHRTVTVAAASALAIDAQLAAPAPPSSAPAPAPVPPQPAPPAPVPSAPESVPAAVPQPAGSPAPYLHPVRLGSQWGYVDPLGQFRVAPMADSAELFSEGRALIAVVTKHGTSTVLLRGFTAVYRYKEYRYGWIDESGRTIIPTESTIGGPFSEGLALAGHATGSARAACDPGALVLAALTNVTGGASEEVTCTPESKVDYIDKSGNVALHTDFAAGQNFSEKLAAVAAPGPKPEDTRWGYIDHTGKLVIAASFLQAHPFSEGLAAVRTKAGAKAKSPEWGFIDQTGALVIQPEFQSAEDFSEGLAAVEYPSTEATAKPSHQAHPLEKRWGYIDRSGARLNTPSFVRAQPFHEGFAAVTTEVMVVPEGGTPKNPHMVQHAQLSFIDHTGRIVIPGPFQATSHFSGGLAAVKQNGLWGYIDTTGAFRIPPQFQAAHIFRGDRAAVQLGAKWGFIDRSGKFVVPPQFDNVK